MRNRAQLAAMAALIALVIGSCTDSSVTTSSKRSATTASAPTSTTTAEDPELGVTLPVDPDVIRGQLDSGLTYYIRENDSPGGRAELRLLVDAGSVQEDPDQRGMAHFLEHMMFNGTETYPRNELIDVLEAFGPRFGPDINAFTSYDETVYELGLTTDDQDLMQLGIDVLREWATRATLTEPDVVGERGVILDEWRTRAQGFGARVNEHIESLILPGTVYEDHEPIGTAEAIEATSPAELRRFYDDWYDPNRMAVTAVGDFDARDVESLIIDAFEDMAEPQSSRHWSTPSFEVPQEPRVRSFVDEEATLAGVTVIWPRPSEPAETIGDYQRTVLTTIGLEILADRLSDDASSGDGALLDASPFEVAWTRTIGLHGVDTQVRAGRADEGLGDVLYEVERMRRDGITEDEFDRAIARYGSLSRQLHEQRESVQDTQFTDQLVNHHLSGGELMSPDQRFDVESGILARVDIDDVNAALKTLVESPPAVLVVGPDDDELDIPDEDRILDVLASLPMADLGERETAEATDGVLMERPAPAPIVNTTIDPRFGFTTLQFDNGATVYLWESDIAAEGVFGLVEGFGGTSRIAVEDLPEAFLMTEIVGRSGLGEFDVPALRRLLTDRIASVVPWITETRQGIEAGAASDEIETMFQLIYLTMTAPRFDRSAIDAVLDEMATVNASRGDVPSLLFQEAVNDLYYGDDPRYFVVPDEDQLADFDVAATERLFSERFGNAGDFAFVFVGDFDSDEIGELAASYVGTLPGTEEATGFVDHQPLPLREVQVATVEAGVGEHGQVGMFFTNPFRADASDRVTARLVELIVSRRLRDRIREELSATYSIQAGVDLQRDPDPYAEAFVISSGDPVGLDQIADEVIADLESLQTAGPTDEEFSTAVAQMRDELDLVNNRTLADGLVTAHLYPDQPVSEMFDARLLLDDLTPGDVRAMASKVFNLDERIEVRQIPRT